MWSVTNINFVYIWINSSIHINYDCYLGLPLAQGAAVVAQDLDPVLNHAPGLIPGPVPSLARDLHSPEVVQDHHVVRVQGAALVPTPLENSLQWTMTAMVMIKHTLSLVQRLSSLH
jgi:hypothetical protein